VIRQESIIFYRPEDTVNHAKALGDPIIVVLPFEGSPASVSLSIDDLRLSGNSPITLSAEVILIGNKPLALLSMGENSSPKCPMQEIVYHKVSPKRAAHILQDGLMLAMGRFGLHENERNVYDDSYGVGEYNITLAVHTQAINLERNIGRKELSPTFGQACYRQPVTDDQIIELEDLANGRRIALNLEVSDQKYREALRDQVLTLYNLAGLLVRVPPESINFEASLKANPGQKRMEVERLFTSAQNR